MMLATQKPGVSPLLANMQNQPLQQHIVESPYARDIESLGYRIEPLRKSTASTASKKMKKLRINSAIVLAKNRPIDSSIERTD